jgi:hypothetical protein
MDKLFLLFCSISILSGCTQVSELINRCNNDNNHSERMNSNYIVIRENPTNSDSIRTKGKKYTISSTEKINDFRSLFKNANKTDYCCCPSEHYIISFYDWNDYVGDYLVDTSEVKDSVRIYDLGYQYSYIIDKSKWKNLLTSTTK